MTESDRLQMSKRVVLTPIGHRLYRNALLMVRQPGQAIQVP